ncbi:DNA-3-methyladenine glycosylase I [Sphingobium yanoikuyae]|uniref:3-methyladenine DNA glycosylase n=1 Tax=Sphingobium yanoikuyae TaxID=13690 RepID=A0A291MYG0_SPHYA|nr:DNA-3-methyladenine glycosylase I [Sphingobium yanoikuyae]ATI79940.1 3-methyladenine DNA glycosylase [Sphingobium yanoikuyae]
MEARHRCSWANMSPLMLTYHDTEWGVPEHDPRMLWETLMLEGFQAGLSWEIILRKRAAFREAFADFDPVKVAQFDSADVERLMTNPGIVRARAKIEATVRGARIFNEMQARGEDFATFCWEFTDGNPIAGTASDTQTDLSALISKELKRRGFKFVGPTIVYAWMQAVGLVNDHSALCFRREMVARTVALPG